MLFLILPYLLLLLGRRVCAYDCPLPECDECLPAFVREAPGVGFELTTSYGTASTHYFNGSRFDVKQVPASGAYRELLHRLSLLAKAPQTTTWQRYLRQLNKRLGRPATKDVGVLSELLFSLRSVTEAQLKRTLDRVVVTTPQFPALTREDLQDAVEYAGMKSWLDYPLPYPTMLYAPNAAYAANGRGLCQEWRNLYACLEEAEDGDIPLEQVFAITFNNASLITSLTRINYAFSRDDYTGVSVSELGLSRLSSYPSPAVYWKDVEKYLRKSADNAAMQGRHITALILTGENAGLREFKEVMRDAFSGLAISSEGDKTKIEEHGAPSHTSARQNVFEKDITHPLWAPARGAAMFARVRQEVPWNCLEAEECRGEPKAMRGQSSQSLLGKQGTEL